MALLEELVALVAPPRCAVCGAAGASAGEVLCAACRRGLAWLPDPRCRRCALPLPHARGGHCPATHAAFDTAWAAVAYEGAARQMLLALKFAAARPLADVMAAQILAAVQIDSQATLVVVPAHPRRRRARGFDAAELIAAALARRSGLALHRGLRRGGGASRQLGASRAQRRSPAGLDFRARGVAPARVVLVDDVHTTGATLDACAAALRCAGSLHITAITWARTLDDCPR
ncbi:MAG TPA: double zinc ribbon domain-containing protein [Solirubrobacteraceae bacterium]|nr:double zinc ribbon domain-containing protein [Solirubrobacteraceae bacterium]